MSTPAPLVVENDRQQEPSPSVDGVIAFEELFQKWFPNGLPSLNCCDPWRQSGDIRTAAGEAEEAEASVDNKPDLTKQCVDSATQLSDDSTLSVSTPSSPERVPRSVSFAKPQPDSSNSEKELHPPSLGSKSFWLTLLGFLAFWVLLTCSTGSAGVGVCTACPKFVQTPMYIHDHLFKQGIVAGVKQAQPEEVPVKKKFRPMKAIGRPLKAIGQRTKAIGQRMKAIGPAFRRRHRRQSQD